MNDLLGNGAAVILMSHLVPPTGRVKPELSLKPVALGSLTISPLEPSAPEPLLYRLSP